MPAQTRPGPATSGCATPAGQRAGQGPQGRPVRAVEEPRGPHREPAGQAGVDRHHRPRAAPGLPAGGSPRLIFTMPHEQASQALDGWIGWACRCCIPAFVKLQKSIVLHRDSILAAIKHGLSNGRIESVNTKIADHPGRLRLPVRPRPDRPGHALPRRPPTHSPRPKMTHTSVRRAGFLALRPDLEFRTYAAAAAAQAS